MSVGTQTTTRLSEREAREALRRAGSPAAEYWYRARRDQGYWVMAWDRRLGPTPKGVRMWVVTDSGACAEVAPGERVTETLGRLGRR